MSSFLKVYGDTEGPFGFPMKDADAKALDAIAREHPGAEYVRAVVEKATSELTDGERGDVSWIQTEAIDRQSEIVLQSGFRDDQYQANPIVTLNHSYYQPPVGRSLWRKKVKDGSRRGVKAKTIYPTKPEEWSEDTWAPDQAWSLVKAGLMAGKSIGFLALKSHNPTDEEIKKNPELAKIWRIVDEWLLLEYACCWMPANQETLVEAVSKSIITPEALKYVGVEIPPTGRPNESIIPFTPMEEIVKAIERQFERIDVKGLAKKMIQDSYDKARGKV